MTREEFEERYQAFQLRGEDDIELMFARLYVLIANLIPGYFQATGGTVPEKAFRKIDDFLPSWRREKRKRAAGMDGEQTAKALGCF